MAGEVIRSVHSAYDSRARIDAPTRSEHRAGASGGGEGERSAADGGSPLGLLSREQVVREGDVADLGRERVRVLEVVVDERLQLLPLLRLAHVRVDEDRAREGSVGVVVDRLRGWGHAAGRGAAVDLDGLELVGVLDVVRVAKEH